MPTPTKTLVVTSTPSPIPTSTPTITPLPTETATPTATPTAVLLVEAGTPLPQNLEAITLENAWQVSGLAEWSESSVVDMEWTPDNQLLAVASSDAINLYQVDSRESLRTLYPQNDGIVDIAFSPGGSWLVEGSRRGDEASGYASSLELWAGPNWKPLGLLYGAPTGLNAITFEPEGNFFAASYSSPANQNINTIDFWQTSNWTINTSAEVGTILSFAFSPDSRLFAGSPDRYSIRIWDLTQNLLIFRFPTSFTGAVNTMVFSPDGGILATGHYDGMVRLWNVVTGEILLEFNTGAVVQSLAFSPDGSIIASGGSFENSAVQLWSSGSGEMLRSLESPTSGIIRLVFSPSGQYLVSAAYDGLVRLWGIRP